MKHSIQELEVSVQEREVTLIKINKEKEELEVQRRETGTLRENLNVGILYPSPSKSLL